MNGFRPVIDCEEKEDACEKIKAQRVHVAHAMPGEKLIRQSPWPDKKQADRGEKLRVPIKELIEKIGKHVPERAAVIDCRLAALRAEMPAQKRAAVLATRERLALRFPLAEKVSSCTWRFFHYGNRRITQDQLCRFVVHVEQNL